MLVKVLVIAILFPGGEARVIIAHDYILKEINRFYLESSSPRISYQLLERESFNLHLIDNQKNTRTVIDYEPKGQWQLDNVKVEEKTLVKETSYLGCNCLHFREKIITSGQLFGGTAVDEKNIIACKSPLIEDYIKDSESLQFLGFYNHSSSNQHFPFELRVFFESEVGEDFDLSVVTSIKEEVFDSTLFSELLSIPLENGNK